MPTLGRWLVAILRDQERMNATIPVASRRRVNLNLQRARARHEDFDARF